MQNLEPPLLAQIREAICRPEGTVTFEYFSPELFDTAVKGGVLLEVPAGQHLFRLERNDELALSFFHSSPGTGTRVATIDLNSVPRADQIFLAFSWTPAEIRLHLAPRTEAGELVTAIGLPSQRKFRIGTNGIVFQLGDLGVEMMGVSFYQGGNAILRPTALEAWRETLQAIDLLGTGRSEAGYIYEAVMSNITIALLVTGFEAYGKTRFVELEQEGIQANATELVSAFYPKREIEAGIYELLQDEAREGGISLIQHLISRNLINFQSFKTTKLAYGKTYGIRFGELGMPSQDLDRLQKFIRYRHKIVHVSPMLGMLNQERVPPEEPEFPKRETANEAIQRFTEFIERLHDATLRLRP